MFSYIFNNIHMYEHEHSTFTIQHWKLNIWRVKKCSYFLLLISFIVYCFEAFFIYDLNSCCLLLVFLTKSSGMPYAETIKFNESKQYWRRKNQGSKCCFDLETVECNWVSGMITRFLGNINFFIVNIWTKMARRIGHI